MKKSGYIKLFRTIEDWAWIDDPIMFYFWCRILLMANWEDKEWRGKIIPRGSLVTSLEKLASTLNLSVKQVRTCIERLKKGKEICVDTANNRHLITICEYETYQGDISSEGQIKGKEKGKERATTKEGSGYSDTSDTIVSSVSSYPSQEERNVIDIYTPGVHARTREDEADASAQKESSTPPPPSPKESWRSLTSVRKSALGFNKDRMAEYKRYLFEQELSPIALSLNMSVDDYKKFVSKWTEHSPGDDRIKAEFEPTFDMETRVKNWLGWSEQNKRPAQPNRLEHYKTEMEKFKEMVHGTVRTRSAQGYGPANTPDEQ